MRSFAVIVAVLALVGAEPCDDAADVIGCLKLKGIAALDRALRQEKVALVDGVTLVKTADEVSEKAHEHNETPHDVDDVLADRVSRFFQTHSLQLSLPKFITEAVQGSPVEEGRRKPYKRYGSALLLGLLFKGGLMAMAYKGVALMAGKALMVAKMALMMSLVVLVKKLSGGGDEKVTYEIVKGGGGGGDWESGGGGGHYRRAAVDPMMLAYRGHPQPVGV